MTTLYPLSHEKAANLLQEGRISDSTREYLTHVLNDTREEYYHNRIQAFLSYSDFVAEGDFTDAYNDLVAENASHSSDDQVLARANTIMAVKMLLGTLIREQILDENSRILADTILHKKFNAFFGGKGEYLTTKEEVTYIKDTLQMIAAELL